MLTIRLSRVGKKNHPQYRIVLQDKRKSPKGKSITILGFYHPIEKVFSCNTDLCLRFIKQGAQPSSMVAKLLDKNGVPGMKKYIIRRTKSIKKPQEVATSEEKKEVAGS